MAVKKFDKEYATQFPSEVHFLFCRGIKYEFVKVVDGITTYKYKKTEALFSALAEFYKIDKR